MFFPVCSQISGVSKAFPLFSFPRSQLTYEFNGSAEWTYGSSLLVADFHWLKTHRGGLSLVIDLWLLKSPLPSWQRVNETFPRVYLGPSLPQNIILDGVLITWLSVSACFEHVIELRAYENLISLVWLTRINLSDKYTYEPAIYTGNILNRILSTLLFRSVVWSSFALIKFQTKRFG